MGKVRAEWKSMIIPAPRKLLFGKKAAFTEPGRSCLRTGLNVSIMQGINGNSGGWPAAKATKDKAERAKKQNIGSITNGNATCLNLGEMQPAS